MWVKRALVIIPVVLLAFLLQSVFWVPSTASVSDNDSRRNKLMLYMTANPEDMNVWTSTKTSDTTISDYLFETPIKINHNYEMEPGLADTVLVKHKVVSRVPEGITADEFKVMLAKLFGSQFTEFKSTAEAEADIRIDLETGAVLASGREPAAGQLTHALKRPAKVEFLLVPPAEVGKVTSAIQPEYEAMVEKELGRRPWPSFAADTLAEAALAAVPADRKAALTKATLQKRFAEALAKLDTTVVSHAPTIEFRLRKGIPWVDGPFFGDPARTWQCWCNGEPCGWVKADSEAQALAAVEAKKLVENPGEAKYAVKTYSERFGDEAGGYWWGKGPELTARDAKMTYEYLKNPDFGSPRISSYQSIKEVRTFDDAYRFDVVYDELYSPALVDLGTGGLLPYHVWNLTAWKEEAIRKGKGPEHVGQTHSIYNVMQQWPSRERDFRQWPSVTNFMVIEPLNGDARPLWENGKRCRLRRNEFHWGRKPEYQFIDYYMFDPNMGRETAEVVFNTGGLDIYAPRDFQVERYEAQVDQYTVTKRLPNKYEYLSFNCSKPQLSDKRVRLALSLAIDVEQILKYVVYNQGVRINGPAYPVLPWYDQEFMIEHTWRTDTKDAEGKVVPRKGKTEKIKFLPYDPAEARAILLECGYEDANGKMVKDGKPLRLEFLNSTGGGSRKNTALLAKDNWQKLGVEIDYREFEWNVFIQQYIMALKFDVCVLGWSGGIDHDSRVIWHSDFWPTKGGLNLAAYSNPKADKLMDGILKVYDHDKQVAMSHEIFREIASDFPYVFLYSPFDTFVFDNRIIWRKEVPAGPDKTPGMEDRPLNHDFVRSARANLKYFFGELSRVEEVPQWKPEDFKR